MIGTAQLGAHCVYSVPGNAVRGEEPQVDEHKAFPDATWPRPRSTVWHGASGDQAGPPFGRAASIGIVRGVSQTSRSIFKNWSIQLQLPPTTVDSQGMHVSSSAPVQRRLGTTTTAWLMTLALVATSFALTTASASAADPPLTEQWATTHPGFNDSSAPTIGDLDGDGIDEIIFGTIAGEVWALRADGSTMWRANSTLVGQSSPSAVGSSPVVADLDNDGDLEIVVGVGTLQVANQQGGVIAFDHLGNRLWSHQGFDTFNMWTNGLPDGYTEGVYSSPGVGDIDGDGYLDVVFGSWDHRIWALDRNGTPVSGFPFIHFDTTWGSPSLYDVDNDGREEVFIGGDASPGPNPEDSKLMGGRFRVLDWNNGTVSERYPPIERNDIFMSSSVIGDIDGDGRVEVIVGGGISENASARQVWAFHADDGSMLPGFPVQLTQVIFSSPALGDVDGDGEIEIVIHSMSDGSDSGLISVIENDGTIKWQVDGLEGDFPGAVVSYLASPIIIDADGDGGLDIVSQSNIFTFVVDGADGHRLPGGRLNRDETWGSAGGPLAADFGEYGWLLIVDSHWPGGTTGTVRAYSLPTQGPVENLWPMWRGNREHTAAPLTEIEPIAPGQCFPSVNPAASPDESSSSGYWILDQDGHVDAFDAPHLGDLATEGVTLGPGVKAVAITETHSGNGYWILDSTGTIYSFGDATDHGGVGHLDLNAPIISMAALPTGDGYWLLGGDGGVFTFGEARFHGSTGAMTLNAPVISMAPTADGSGYWLLAADGGVFTFGNAVFRGSTGAMQLDAPVISMAVHPAGTGYWLLGGDGGVFSFSAPFYGSVPGLGLCSAVPAMELRPTSAGRGYYALATNGMVYTFGDAQHRGEVSGGNPVDLAVSDS